MLQNFDMKLYPKLSILMDKTTKLKPDPNYT